MKEKLIRLSLVENLQVTAIRAEPGQSSAKWLFIYAPGAGGNLQDPFGIFARRHITAQRIATLHFQFPYMELGRKRPDRNEVLEAVWRQIIEMFGDEGLKLAVGGRSMGGRIASQVLAQGTLADRLVLLAYPLHPPGKSGQWRDQHFQDVSVPTLFCSGTRDTFAKPEELRVAASRMPHSTVHFLDSADHSFTPTRKSGRTQEQVWRETLDVLVNWLDGED